MASKLNINVMAKYGSTSSIIISSRQEFLRTAAEKFNLDVDEIEIFDIKNKKIIAVEELMDFIKVEIKKKPSYALTSRSESPDPPLSKEPDRNVLVQKLLDNCALTGEERAFIVNLLEDSYHPTLKRRNEDKPAGQKMKHRKVQVEAANLIAFETSCTQTEETSINSESTLDESKSAEAIMIKSKSRSSADKIDDAIVNDLLAKTYDKRRNFIIMKRPLASFVKEKYPLLFKTPGVKNELDRIFYVGKCKEFEANIEKYAPHVLCLRPEFDPLVEATRRAMDASETDEQKKYAEEVGALLVLSFLLKEDRAYLKLDDNNSEPGDFPYIQVKAKQDDLYFDKHTYQIFVERTLLCEAANFKEAVLCLVASYFIFNIKYPKVNFNTLVAFEKLFLEADDTAEREVDDNTFQIIRCVELKYELKVNGGVLKM